jgi:anaerobic magnesium-protoporphyrin IX monomethyl ester cyclase
MKRYTRAWHYLDHLSPRLTGYNIIASRGCPWDCAYCQPTLRTLFGTKVRYHSPGWVFDEMVRAKGLYDVDGVFFHDDTFTANKEWCYDVCNAIKGLGMLWGCNIRADTVTPALLHSMYLAGCRNVHIGIEAASDRVRNGCYRKRLDMETIVQACEAVDRTGIAAMGFFMLGAPEESDEEIEDTIRLACSLPLAEATFSICSPLPGTHLYNEFGAGTTDYYGSDARWHLRRKQYEALLRFYGSHKRYLLKHLVSCRGIERLIRKLGRFLQ